MTVRLGAEASTSRYDVVGYGGVGPYAGEPGVVHLPAAGRYAILAVGSAPRDPDCRLTGIDQGDRSAELVAIPPGDYGTDAVSFARVASVGVPDGGTYSLTCRSSYILWEIPHIRGLVGRLVHWPLTAIWLLGTVPGLLIITSTARRHARSSIWTAGVS